MTETASGGDINSQKDIVTMKEILGDRYEFIVLNKPEATSVNIRNKLNREILTYNKECEWIRI